LTQTCETRQGHKCLIDADIMIVNCDCPTGGERFFFVRYTRMHRCRCMRVKEKKSDTFNDDIITHSHSLCVLFFLIRIYYNIIQRLYDNKVYDIIINLNLKFLLLIIYGRRKSILRFVDVDLYWAYLNYT